MLLSACATPVTPARLALRGFLADVQAHSVVYAYTLLSTEAANQTEFLPFFNGVKATKATFTVGSCHEDYSEAVTCQVNVSSPGAAPRQVTVQMVEEGNAGDWLVGKPFTSHGAAAIKLFE